MYCDCVLLKTALGESPVSRVQYFIAIKKTGVLIPVFFISKGEIILNFLPQNLTSRTVPKQKGLNVVFARGSRALQEQNVNI